ncbi:MAG: hypothetical protein Q8P34_02840 [Bacteroidota bacterium]|nr:hypothetical protein [Bacteroidota bacterium]
MERSILEKQLAVESELVKDESMLVLKEFEYIDVVCSNCNLFDVLKLTEDHSANCN